MRKLTSSAIALGLLAGCAGVAGVAVSKADTVSQLCGTYAKALQSATPWKADVSAEIATVIGDANAVGGIVCTFSPVGPAFTAAVEGWVKSGGA
jgi:hypothetical protein